MINCPDGESVFMGRVKKATAPEQSSTPAKRPCTSDGRYFLEDEGGREKFLDDVVSPLRPSTTHLSPGKRRKFVSTTYQRRDRRSVAPAPPSFTNVAASPKTQTPSSPPSHVNALVPHPSLDAAKAVSVDDGEPAFHLQSQSQPHACTDSTTEGD